MKRFLKRSAFTIVEMVIVIAVIGILATVMVPTISGMIEEANKSVDQQFAANLTIQLAVESVDGGINSEADLRRIVDQYYGEWDGDTLVTSYYDTKLVPKAAKSGNHFWYNVVDGSVTAGTYAEISAMPGPASATAGVPSAPPTPDFEKANPRTIGTASGNYFFLMDQDGNDLIDQLNALEEIGGNAAYAEVVTKIDAITGDADLATVISNKLKTTAIGNNQGVFFYSDWGTTATEVFVPYGVETLGASKVAADKLNVTDIYLPSTITSLGTGSLLGLTCVQDDALWSGSTTIHMQVSAAELVGGMVASDAMNCVIQVSTGERFAFVSGKLTNLSTGESHNTNYSVELEQFDVKVEGDNADFHLMSDRTQEHILHINSDTTTITLTAFAFVDENNNSTTRPVSWKKGGVEIGTDAALELNATQLADGDTITVSAQNLTYTIKVKVVAVDEFTATFGGQSGNPMNGAYITYVLGVDYAAGDSWQIIPTVNATIDCANISLNKDITIEFASGEASKLHRVNDTYYVKVNDGVTGTFTETIIVTTIGKGMDGQAKKVAFEVTFNEAGATFDIADNANTQNLYGDQYIFTVGTVNPIKLGTLFQLAEGEPNNITVGWALQDGDESPLTMGNTDAAWTEWTFTPSTAGEYKIIIHDGGSQKSLLIKVVSGAHNVSNEDEWLAVGNSTNICLLKDITFSDYENNATKEGAQAYSKQINAATLYGNFSKITFNKFLIKVKTDNRFLLLSSGTISNTIIEGPEYPEATLTQSKGGPTGYHVHGITISGDATISNSYISGFRAPIRTNGGTVTIENSTLRNGAFTNIWIFGVKELIINNSYIVQTVNSHGIIGAGIYVDNNDDYITKGAIIRVDDNSQWYCWLDNKTSYGDKVNAIRGALLNTNGCGGQDIKLTDYVHTINGEAHISAGIALECDKKYVTTYLPTSFNTGITKSGITVYTYKACSSCDHTLLPGGVTTYNGDTFRNSFKN